MKWVITFALVIYGAHSIGIRFNHSGSMPVGFYLKRPYTQIHRGDVVSACLNVRWARIGKERGYLQQGECAADSEPVVKRVIAVPGDRIYITQKGISVNGQFYKATIFLQDKKRRTLQNANVMCQSILLKGYWLYGDNNKKLSWDSRYFGEVNAQNITGKYIPVMTRRSEKVVEWFSTSDSTTNSQKQKNTKASNPQIKKENHCLNRPAPTYFPQGEKFPDPAHPT